MNTSRGDASIGGCANNSCVSPSGERITRSRKARIGGGRWVSNWVDNAVVVNTGGTQTLVGTRGLSAISRVINGFPLVVFTYEGLASSNGGFSLVGDNTLSILAFSLFTGTSSDGTSTSRFAVTRLKITDGECASSSVRSLIAQGLRNCGAASSGINDGLVGTIRASGTRGDRLASTAARGITESTASCAAGSDRGKTAKTSSDIIRSDILQVGNRPSRKKISGIIVSDQTR